MPLRNVVHRGDAPTEHVWMRIIHMFGPFAEFKSHARSFPNGASRSMHASTRTIPYDTMYNTCIVPNAVFSWSSLFRSMFGLLYSTIYYLSIYRKPQSNYSLPFTLINQSRLTCPSSQSANIIVGIHWGAF